MKGLMNTIGESATRLGSKVAFKIKKASPELLLIGGIACIVGGTVLACKATKKASDILDEGKEKIEELNEEMDAAVESSVDEALPEIKRDIVKSKFHTLGKLAAAYGPAVALGSAGVAMIFTSHGIMRKRQGALLASYNALDAMFKTYRSRVLAEEDGKERDRRYMIGDEAELKTSRELIPNGDGELVEDINDKAHKLMASQGIADPYTFIFSKETSYRWQSHAFSNLNLIRSAEDWGTSQLRLNGHLFLNDILKFLGMDEVPWGQLVGWIRGSKDGDSYVELIAMEDFETFRDDHDAVSVPMIITANCDGEIWDKL